MNKYLTLTFVILLSIAAYLYYVIPSCVDNVAVCFDPLNSTLAPSRYRILQPTLELLAGVHTQAGLIAVDTVIHTLALVIFFPGLYLWLKRWMNEDRAIVGVILTALMLMLAYRIYFRSVTTMIELACLVWSLVLIRGASARVGSVAYAALIILATLNRETGFMLVVVYVAYNWAHIRERVNWIYSLMVFLASIAITAAIHLALGTSDHMLGLAGTLQYNVGNAPESIFSLILLSPLFAMVALRFKASSPVLKRLTIVAGLYLVAVLVGGALNELPRLALPALVLTLPVMLYKEPTDNAVPLAYFGGQTIYLEPEGEITVQGNTN